MSEYGRFELEYIKTDRNGTRIYHDNNCPRCCGYGELEKWAYTGRVCFECGGSGVRRKPKVVKIYTKEYAEKLEERRLEREKKRLAKITPQTERELEERAKEALGNARENEGLSRDGSGYVYIGNTYAIKEKLKQVGARWNTFIHGWIAPKPPESMGIDLRGVKCAKIESGALTNENGYLDPEKLIELKGKMEERE